MIPPAARLKLKLEVNQLCGVPSLSGPGKSVVSQLHLRLGLVPEVAAWSRSLQYPAGQDGRSNAWDWQFLALWIYSFSCTVPKHI